MHLIMIIIWCWLYNLIKDIILKKYDKIELDIIILCLLWLLLLFVKYF